MTIITSVILVTAGFIGGVVLALMVVYEYVEQLRGKVRECEREKSKMALRLDLQKSEIDKVTFKRRV